MGVQPGEEDVGEPFPGIPEAVGLGIGKDVVQGNAVMGKNPLAGADMPACVAVAQEGLNTLHPPKNEGERHEERHIRE
jgi:hypothetical protein